MRFQIIGATMALIENGLIEGNSLAAIYIFSFFFPFRFGMRASDLCLTTSYR
jgi:hypothetical protein